MITKIAKLRNILKQMGSVLVAFSGGVDSSFLLKVAVDTLGKNVLAVTAVSPTYPREELAFAKKMARLFKARHKIIRTSEIKDKNFFSNPPNRCYFCKKELFGRLKQIAREEKINFVLDASNVSDKADFRPGALAKKEYGARSPLAEAGFTKDDIRKLSKKLGLATWDKPSLACLASRVPYGTVIAPKIIKRIDQGEKILRNFGFKQVRLRHYQDLCRLEFLKKDIPLVLAIRSAIIKKLKGLGYHYITLDLEGYRSGSLNEVIAR